MKRLLIACAFAFIAVSAHAQDLTGTWQGSTPSGRKVFQLSKAPSGGYRGQLYFLEDKGGTLNGNPLRAESRPNGKVRIDLTNRMGIFEGVLSNRGDAMVGTWQGSYSSQPLSLSKADAKTAWPIDPARHDVRFISVDKGVKLEVLDWGGSGRPLSLLAGLGDTAHDFDSIAPKLAGRYHVYGITRRGFGLSSAPEPTESNYGPDRLADDDLEVLHALGMKCAFFAGHSIAGQELSSMASRHPENIIGLIYLDSAYDYAYFYPGKDIDAARWDGVDVFIPMLRRDLADLPNASPAEAKRLIPEIQLLLPRLEAGLANYQIWPQPSVRMREQRIRDAILASAKAYPGNSLPILAIYALPKKCAVDCSTPAQMAADLAFVKAFAIAHPNARVVRWPNEEHYVHHTRQDDVVREMRGFMDGVR